MRELNRGQAILTASVFFVLISLSISIGIAGPTIRSASLLQREDNSLQSLALAEALVEDVVFRTQNRLSVDTVESLALGTYVAFATTTIDGNTRSIEVAGNVRDTVRALRTDLTIGSGAAFNYGVQTHLGGFIMENSSVVRGNLFSNGAVVGSGNNLIYGDIISAGPNGSVSGIHATGTVWSNVIEDAMIEGDAFYQTITNSTVLGMEFPGSEDQATSTLPITDTQVEAWEEEALLGGVIDDPCPYVIGDDTYIGPVKIACDVIIQNDAIVTIGGIVWIEGDLTFNNTPTVRLDPLLEEGSVPIIADNPADQLTSSTITINNANEFIGLGLGSYVLLLSQNRSAENGGTQYAIDISNSAEGDLLLYAGHGEVRMNNNTSLKEISAWRVRLRNNAEVIYETGLANTLFTSGPSGGYIIESWIEIE